MENRKNKINLKHNRIKLNTTDIHKMQLDRIEKSEKHRMEQNIEYNGITPIEKKIHEK